MHCIQDPEVVDKRPLPVDGEILAIQYHTDGSKYQEEEEHDDLQPEQNATLSHSVENNGTISKRKSHDGVAGIPEIKYTLYFVLPFSFANNGMMSYSCLQGCI